jgi:hypothetical protein
MSKKKKNANLSDELVKVNQESSPALGSSVPASKDNRGVHDSGSAKHEVVTVRDAVPVEGVVKSAIKKQLGETPENPAGNATPLANSGCGK